MKRERLVNWTFFFLAPPVMALAVAAMWLAVSAGVENLRTARVSNQVISAIARARAMRIRTNANPDYAQRELVKRIAEADGARLLAITAPTSGAEPELAFANPWGEAIRAFVYPSVQSVRLEVPLSRTACLRLLELYANDTASLGLQRVDVRESLPSALWRLVYEQPQNRKDPERLDLAAIQAGCGNSPETVVSLTFSLKTPTPN